MMKRRDALKGLSFLGLFSTLGVTEAASETLPLVTPPASLAADVPDALRGLVEGLEMISRLKALSEHDQRRLIADLRAKDQDSAADWAARVCSRRA